MGTKDIATLTAGLSPLCSVVGTQSAEHIKPFHAYCASRLVMEGGFPPEWVSPRPPLSSRRENNREYQLLLDPSAKDASERRILGGIKYKAVDVAVTVPSLGPVLGVSAKSTGNAFRNLTNRMEEALGECTNVHLMYPGLVFGFLHLIKFNKLADVPNPNDASFTVQDQPLPSVVRYHEVLSALSGRSAITDSGMRYESVGLLIYRCRQRTQEIWSGYPQLDSPVHFAKFFQRLYDLYDLRFGYPDPDGIAIRKVWKINDASLRVAFDRATAFPWQARSSGDVQNTQGPKPRGPG